MTAYFNVEEFYVFIIFAKYFNVEVANVEYNNVYCIQWSPLDRKYRMVTSGLAISKIAR